MTNLIQDLETYTTRVEEMKEALAKYDFLSGKDYRYIKTKGLGLNESKLKSDESIIRLRGEQEESLGLIRRLQAAYFEHRTNTVKLMQARIDNIADRIERLEALYIKLRMDLNKSLNTESFCICDRYFICFGEGVSKAKFDLSRAELCVASCLKEHFMFPAACIIFDSVQAFVMHFLAEKGYDYENTVIPPQLAPQNL